MSNNWLTLKWRCLMKLKNFKDSLGWGDKPTNWMRIITYYFVLCYIDYSFTMYSKSNMNREDTDDIITYIFITWLFCLFKCNYYYDLSLRQGVDKGRECQYDNSLPASPPVIIRGSGNTYTQDTRFFSCPLTWMKQSLLQDPSSVLALQVELPNPQVRPTPICHYYNYYCYYCGTEERHK